MAEETKKLPQDFVDLLAELTDASAEFLVVGGWAVILHEHVRATDDLDVFVRPSAENASRVYAALSEFGAPLAAHQITTHGADGGAESLSCSLLAPALVGNA